MEKSDSLDDLQRETLNLLVLLNADVSPPTRRTTDGRDESNMTSTLETLPLFDSAYDALLLRAAMRRRNYLTTCSRKTSSSRPSALGPRPSYSRERTVPCASASIIVKSIRSHGKTHTCFPESTTHWTPFLDRDGSPPLTSSVAIGRMKQAHPVLR